MGPDVAISVYEQVVTVGRALEEEGRFQPQAFAPKVEHAPPIYHASPNRFMVRAHPSAHPLAERPPVKQGAKTVEPSKPFAKIEAVPASPNPITNELASLPPAADVKSMPTEDSAVPPAPPVQVEKEPEEPRNNRNELTMRTIPPDDTSTPDEPVPVPVPLPGELDKQVPEDVLVTQQVDAARRYLVRVACPGNTMSRQGEDVAVGRLHPVFAVRLAAAIKQARREGSPGACPFSTYRPPAFGVGGYRNKYDSMHAYGLAADISGIGRPGSAKALIWWRVVHENGLYLPYGPYNHSEWNHTQLLHQKGRQFVESHPVRRTITAYGPINLITMWIAAGVDMLKVAPDHPTEEAMPSPSGRRAIDRARHRRRSPRVEYADRRLYRHRRG
jgi:hypothetical protein